MDMYTQLYRRYASLAQRWIKLSDLNNHLVTNLPPYHLPSIKLSHHSQLLSKHPTTPQSNLLLSCPLSFNQLFSIFPNSMPRTFFILQLPMLYSVLSFRATSKIKKKTLLESRISVPKETVKMQEF